LFIWLQDPNTAVLHLDPNIPFNRQITAHIIHPHSAPFAVTVSAPTNWENTKLDFKDCKSALAAVAAPCEDGRCSLDRFTAVFQHTLLPNLPEVEVPFYLAFTPSRSFSFFVGSCGRHTKPIAASLHSSVVAERRTTGVCALCHNR